MTWHIQLGKLIGMYTEGLEIDTLCVHFSYVLFRKSCQDPAKKPIISWRKPGPILQDPVKKFDNIFEKTWSDPERCDQDFCFLIIEILTGSYNFVATHFFQESLISWLNLGLKNNDKLVRILENPVLNPDRILENNADTLLSGIIGFLAQSWFKK